MHISPTRQSFKTKPVRIIRFQKTEGLNPKNEYNNPTSPRIILDSQKYINNPEFIGIKSQQIPKKSSTNSLHIPDIKLSSPHETHESLKICDSNFKLIRQQSAIDSLTKKDIYNSEIKPRNSKNYAPNNINEIATIRYVDDKVGNDEVGSPIVSKLKKTNSTMESSGMIKSRINNSSNSWHNTMFLMNDTDNKVKLDPISSKGHEKDFTNPINYASARIDTIENHMNDALTSEAFEDYKIQGYNDNCLVSPKSDIGSPNSTGNMNQCNYEDKSERNGVKMYRTIGRFVEAKAKADMYNDKIIKQYQFDKENEEEELNFMELCDVLKTHV